jgi:hypothetical protein
MHTVDWMSPIGVPEALVFIIVFLMFFVVPVYLGYRIAKQKGLPPFRWVILTLLFSWPIVIALLLFPKAEENLKNTLQ